MRTRAHMRTHVQRSKCVRTCTHMQMQEKRKSSTLERGSLAPMDSGREGLADRLAMMVSG